MPQVAVDRERFHRYMKPSSIIAEIGVGFLCRSCWRTDGMGVRLDDEKNLHILCSNCGNSTAVTEENFEDGTD